MESYPYLGGSSQSPNILYVPIQMSGVSVEQIREASAGFLWQGRIKASNPLRWIAYGSRWWPLNIMYLEEGGISAGLCIVFQDYGRELCR